MTRQGTNQPDRRPWGNRAVKLPALTLAVALALTGCAPTDLGEVMGRTDGTPVSEPRKIDCNLIFPPSSVAP